jgi:hypothetical protein
LWQATTIAAGSKATTKAKSAIPVKEPFELEKELLEKPKKKPSSDEKRWVREKKSWRKLKKKLEEARKAEGLKEFEQAQSLGQFKK